MIILKSLVSAISSVELNLDRIGKLNMWEYIWSVGTGLILLFYSTKSLTFSDWKHFKLFIGYSKVFLSHSGVYRPQVFTQKSSFDFTNQHHSASLHKPPSLPSLPRFALSLPHFALLSSAHRAPWRLCCRWPFAETEAPTVDSAASSLVVVKKKSSSWVHCFGCCEVPPRPLTLRFSQRLNF